MPFARRTPAGWGPRVPHPGGRPPPRVEHRVVADDGHVLAVYEKTAPHCRTTLLLLHGRTWSSVANFDLPVPGASLMDRFCADGYRVLALDQRGYGKTLRDSSAVATPDRAVADVAAVLRWAGGRATVLGYSWGSLVAHLTAQRHPELLGAIVLHGHPAPADFDWAAVENAPPERQPTTAEAAAEDFIVDGHRPEVIDAYVRVATDVDRVLVDWSELAQFGAIDPAAVRVPTLLINGDRDPHALGSKLEAHERQLGTRVKARVVLENADHAAHLGAIDRFTAEVSNFIRSTAPVVPAGGLAP